MSICTIPEALPPAPPIPHNVLACDECGCREVETSAWVYFDWLTGEERICDDEGPTDDAWCPQCAAHVGYRNLDYVEIHPAEIEAHITSQQVND